MPLHLSPHDAQRMGLAPKVKKPSKYRNIREKLDGHTFDSRAELRRYVELKHLERIGEIRQLVVHPVYRLHSDGTEIGKYIGDFQYLDQRGRVVLEDVKSPSTRTKELYRWKRKHLHAEYGIVIQEIV